MSAFYALSTCRYVGMSEGPIPWTAINEYCETYGIDGELREEVFYHVRKLDSVYLRHGAKKMQENKGGGPKGKLQAKPGSNWARGR